MKTLYLVRHAKTVEGSPDLKDFDRYLKPRGISDSRVMASLMKKNSWLPETIITSPAKRARQTAELFCEIFQYSHERIVEEKSLYYGGQVEMIDLLQNISNDSESVMIIGHNPTIHEVVNYLVGYGIEHYPTCAVSGLRFNINLWIEITLKKGELLFFEVPKNIR
ncbi:MAG: histidine phosphatase family protein [Candidatus Marinimicrobia bacterium]|nr:histidine phosphatase family protein [Candidatus Neomarinimicrobiota bacterium]